ncbi:MULTISPECIES: nitrate- and nitrite sensing domain-containing protein [Sorangium]|uniref:nitrate- and nitrite sensing domain-containing protein n=1 Tax=Sorangium TaxID=39643 RepID=UPI003D9C16EF
MPRLRDASIRLKLWSLAGVPVVGALLLAAMIVGDARRQAERAAGIGSIEDLAQLSSIMAQPLHALQKERARTALVEGLEVRPQDARDAESAQGTQGASRPFQRDAALARAGRELSAARAATDERLAHLDAFLAERDLSRLPPRLARDLAEARSRVRELGAFRSQADAKAAPLDSVLKVFGGINASLIRANAGLSELSDDGELLRSIQSLVAVHELAERASRQHALLAHAFASTQFEPGAFKTLVTLMTEEELYREVFMANASESARALHDASRADARVRRAHDMRAAAVASTDEALAVDHGAWFDAQQGRLDRLAAIEIEALTGMRRAAAAKVADTRRTVRNGVAVSAFVLLMSVALAFVLVRGISRSLEVLGEAAAHVRRTRDYTTRARKTADDEFGALTDAFNEMLAGIQARDEALEGHRQNLEATVAERTGELEKRNGEMRLVLDNVDQALVTIRRDGTMEPAYSAAFERLFGAPPPDEHFADRVADHDPRARAFLRMGWEAASEDFLPLEVVLDQLPKLLLRGGRHLTLGFKPILSREGQFNGALMVITDVTATMDSLREYERQREYIQVFERAVKDRLGLVGFVNDTSKLVDAVCARAISEVDHVMRLVHTIKGNAGLWGVTSVANVAHEIESFVVEERALPPDGQIDALRDAWCAFVARVSGLLASTAQAMRVDVAHEEIEALLEMARQRREHAELERAIEALRNERTDVRFNRMKDQAETLARRLGKPKPDVRIDAGGVRLSAARFAAMWQALGHVVRNVMDHGIEMPEARERAGKPPSGALTLRSRLTADEIVIEIGDDGAGIDWERVREKAAAVGLPSATRRDLEAALFAPGFSTAEQVTDVSGRGVGLGVALHECRRLSGRVEIDTTPGEGTTFRFRFPRELNEASALPAGAPSASLPPSSRRGGLLAGASRGGSSPSYPPLGGSSPSLPPGGGSSASYPPGGGSSSSLSPGGAGGAPSASPTGARGAVSASTMQSDRSRRAE